MYTVGVVQSSQGRAVALHVRDKDQQQMVTQIPLDLLPGIANNPSINGSASADPAAGYTSGMARSQTCGLRNLGNTCYMNAVIQVFTNTRIRDYVLKPGTFRAPGSVKLTSDELTSDEKNLLDQPDKDEDCRKGWIQATIATMVSLSADTASVPTQVPVLQLGEFRKCLIEPFANGTAQEDAHEFMLHLLNAVMPQVREDIGLCSQDKKVCKQCSAEETCGPVTYTPDISLALPEKSVNADDAPSVQSLLDLHFGDEVLDGDEMISCTQCAKNTVQTKTNCIQKLSKTIILHLKRFSNNNGLVKLMEPVNLTMSLDMSRHVTHAAARVSGVGRVHPSQVITQ